MPARYLLAFAARNEIFEMWVEALAALLNSAMRGETTAEFGQGFRR
jgi:hypothetical protein